MAHSRVRSLWALFFGLGGAATWLGCNALAGIELGTLAPSDSGAGGSDSTTPSDDGGGHANPGSDAVAKNDGSGGDAGNGGDGGTSDAGAPTYTCTGSGSPFAVASLENATDGGRQFNTEIVMGLDSNQRARILIELSQGNNAELFRVYDVQFQPTSLDESWTVPVPTTDSGNGGNGYLMNAETTPSGIVGLVQSQTYDPVGNTNDSTLYAYPIPASAQGPNDVPAPYPLTPPIPNFNGQASFLELGQDDDFLVEQVQPPAGSGALLQSSRSSRAGGPGTPQTFGSSTELHNDPPALAHGGTNVFALFGGDPSSDAGSYVYRLPDNPNTVPTPAAGIAPTSLPSGTLVAGVYPSVTDSTKIATFLATLVSTASTTSFTVYAGLVSAANFDSVQLSALNQGPTLGIHEVPAGKGSNSFANDQMALVGLSPVASDQGINFVWMDVTGRVLAKAVGDSRLYNDRAGILSSAIVYVQSIGNALTTFYVAWIEEHTDDGGLYDTLYIDQLSCAN